MKLYTITEAALKGFELGEESTTEYGRKFVCSVMRNILAIKSRTEIHDYCERMIELHNTREQATPESSVPV